MLKNHDLQVWTFCRSLLVCIHDNRAIAPHLMQAALPQTELGLHWKHRMGAVPLAPAVIVLVEIKNKGKKNLSGLRCWPYMRSSEQINVLMVIPASREKPLWQLLYLIGCSAPKYIQPTFTLLTFYSSNTNHKLHCTFPLPKQRFSDMLTSQVYFTDKGISKAKIHVVLPVRNWGDVICSEASVWECFSISTLSSCLVFFSLAQECV